MLRRSIEGSLRAALDGRGLVSVWRKRLDRHRLDGFVVVLGKSIAALHVLDDGISLNGYVAVRIDDITTVESPPKHGLFYERALRLRLDRRRRPRGLDVADMKRLIASANRRFPVITLHREAADPSVCSIGRIAELTERTVMLDWLTPDATWDGQSPRYRLSTITRVDFGGRYEEALALVVGLLNRA